MPTPHLTLYTARECHLCHEMEQVVREAARIRRLEFAVVDITGHAELESRFRPEIPVLFIGERKAFKYRADLEQILKKIDAVV